MTANNIEANISRKQHALDLLHQMIGVDKDFRPGQWEAIEAVAVKKQRALVVQRTGWGKRLVGCTSRTNKPDPFQPGLF